MSFTLLERGGARFFLKIIVSRKFKIKLKAVKEMIVDRIVKPSNFTRRMNEPLKKFNFGLKECR